MVVYSMSTRISIHGAYRVNWSCGMVLVNNDSAHVDARKALRCYMTLQIQSYSGKNVKPSQQLNDHIYIYIYICSNASGCQQERLTFGPIWCVKLLNSHNDVLRPTTSPDGQLLHLQAADRGHEGNGMTREKQTNKTGGCIVDSGFQISSHHVCWIPAFVSTFL